MEKSEINTVQRRSSGHIQSYYTIISVMVSEAQLERDRGRGRKRFQKHRKKEERCKMGVRVITGRETGEWKHKDTHMNRKRQREQNGRGYYGKEVNLAVMLCLVEKKTGLLCVNYVCVRVHCCLYFSLCMCMWLSHHLPICHHIRACRMCFSVCVFSVGLKQHLCHLKASSVATEYVKVHRRQKP